MYSIYTTEDFDRWLRKLKDNVSKKRIQARIDRLELDGNFGDNKVIDYPVYELRFFFGTGYRVYYMQQGETVVILLAGGDKSTQQKDIDKAVKLASEILLSNEDNNHDC